MIYIYKIHTNLYIISVMGKKTTLLLINTNCFGNLKSFNYDIIKIVTLKMIKIKQWRFCPVHISLIRCKYEDLTDLIEQHVQCTWEL